jgi:hypothetical protein
MTPRNLKTTNLNKYLCSKMNVGLIWIKFCHSKWIPCPQGMTNPEVLMEEDENVLKEAIANSR